MNESENLSYEERVIGALAPLTGEDLARRLWLEAHGPPPDIRPTLKGAVREAVDAWVVKRCAGRDEEEALAVLAEAVDLVIALEYLTECGWLDVLVAVRAGAAGALEERAA